uniref:Uncharacterized protein n=1 Tax=Gorilla gorilla gorilla TaxID=9595 RepID=A0A2I2ZL97_GORGO
MKKDLLPWKVPVQDTRPPRHRDTRIPRSASKVQQPQSPCSEASDGRAGPACGTHHGHSNRQALGRQQRSLSPGLGQVGKCTPRGGMTGAPVEDAGGPRSSLHCEA